MKRLIVSAIVVFVAANAFALQKKPILEVDTNAVAGETQITPSPAGDDHMALVWWIPHEFWQAVLAQDATTSEVDKKSTLHALRPVSLFAVVQADISSFGAFNFYSKQRIEENMIITFTDATGKKQRLMPVQAIDGDFEIIIGIFKPILGAAMGNLGNNFHFFVLNDLQLGGDRLIDPYRKGLIKVQLEKKNNGLMAAEVEMPLNSLFVPRKCPNGKDAHVSWNYCPWTGKRLPD